MYCLSETFPFALPREHLHCNFEVQYKIEIEANAFDHVVGGAHKVISSAASLCQRREIRKSQEENEANHR